MAIWDLFAKRDGRSLSKVLGGTRTDPVRRRDWDPAVDRELLRRSARSVAVLPAREGEDQAGLGRLRRGGDPGDGFRSTVHARRELRVPLADTPLFKRFDAYKPTMSAAGVAHDDIVTTPHCKRQIETAICPTSRSTPVTTRARRSSWGPPVDKHQGWGVGGLPSARRIHDVCRDADHSVWCGECS